VSDGRDALPLRHDFPSGGDRHARRLLQGTEAFMVIQEVQEAYDEIAANRIVRQFNRTRHAHIWIEIQHLAGHYSKAVFDACAVTLATAGAEIIAEAKRDGRL
jgi:predicted nuclease with RNAse H fold